MFALLHRSSFSFRYCEHVMLLMFVLWIAVFYGIFKKWRWTPGLAILTLVVTVILLKAHITDPIPLNF